MAEEKYVSRRVATRLGKLEETFRIGNAAFLNTRFRLQQNSVPLRVVVADVARESFSQLRLE